MTDFIPPSAGHRRKEEWRNYQNKVHVCQNYHKSLHGCFSWLTVYVLYRRPISGLCYSKHISVLHIFGNVC